MPEQSNKLEELREAAGEGEIGYFSKSKIVKWVTCPNKFRFNYLKGYKQKETEAMRRGTDIHEAIEDYYINVTKYVERTGEYPNADGKGGLAKFLPDHRRWMNYTAPYIGNFLAWERRRLEYARSNDVDPSRWIPIGIEEEGWLDNPLDRDDGVPWMGYADVILDAAAFPSVDEDSGAIIVDVKTGKTPDKQYRDEGIFLQGTYYTMVFEEEFDIAGVAGYYPKNDDVITSPPSEKRRELVLRTANEILDGIQAFKEDPNDHFELNEGPLCSWGPDEESQCAYYGICPATWGEAMKKTEKFERMIERGDSMASIASELGMTTDAVWYTRRKLEKMGEI